MISKKRTIAIVSAVFISVSFLFGVVLHTFGYITSHLEFSDLIIIVIRGILRTIRMYFGNFDEFESLIFPEYGVWRADNPWMQVLFWGLNMTAIIGTYSVVLSMFGRRVSNYVRLLFGIYREMYIINEGGKDAFILGENIANSDNSDNKNTKKSKRVVVFIPGEDDDVKGMNNRVSFFGGIVLEPDKKHDLEDYLRKAFVGKYLFHSIRRSKKYNIVLMPGNSSAVWDIKDIYEYVGSLKGNKTIESLNISVFTSSKWGYSKVEEAFEKNHCENKCRNAKFYRFNETGLIINEMFESRFMERCLEPYTSGNEKATEDFSVLIMGFGKMGQEILLHLTEDKHLEGSRIKASIIDKSTEDLISCFKENNEKIYSRDPKFEIVPCESGYSEPCKKFHEFIKETDIIKNFNFIVLAFDDDKVNKQLANDLFGKYAIIFKNNQKSIPFIAVYDKNCTYPVTENDEKDKMFRFGIRKEIYKLSTIMNKKYEYKINNN